MAMIFLNQSDDGIRWVMPGRYSILAMVASWLGDVFLPLLTSLSDVFLAIFFPVPSSAPRNFAVRTVSSRSVVLEWDAPPQQDWNGDLTDYIVSFVSPSLVTH